MAPDNTVLEGVVVPDAAPGTQATLCSCCALMVMNHDDSDCRDHHQHDHESIEGTRCLAVIDGPFPWESVSDLACDGHGGSITGGEHYWTAEHL